ncbi:hypothetical protein EB796_012994 [Bugula neritina]|uniref:Uncharacterized protein n=1 Tax=Bugula neritina TaxID=10212 RepID=A0A7J7JST0_BUGNE|nr:hypothetical protein EB796_012994 [Bugula neritina]
MKDLYFLLGESIATCYGWFIAAHSFIIVIIIGSLRLQVEVAHYDIHCGPGPSLFYNHWQHFLLGSQPLVK